MRLLVVEDDTKLVRALQRGLQREGYVVDVAVTGDDGIAQATASEYDAVVLDVMLPGPGRLRGVPGHARRRARDPRPHAHRAHRGGATGSAASTPAPTTTSSSRSTSASCSRACGR